MKLPEICIKRPVLAIVINLIIILVGLVSLNQLPKREYPRVEAPVISVSVQYPGAGPEIIESLIIKVLETALAGIEGIDVMESTSGTEEAKVNLRFRLDRDIEHAASDVRDKLGRIRHQLPEGVTEPKIRKADSDAAPIIYLALHSDRIAVQELYDYATRYIENALEVMHGVAAVETLGGGQYEMQITLDPIRMAAYHLTAPEVTAAIKHANFERPGGRLITEKKEFMVSTIADLRTPEEFNNLVLAERKGALIRLKDIGTARLNAEDKRNKTYFDGKEAVGINIFMKSTGNPIEISAQLKKLLPELQSNMPDGMKIDIAYDKTIFIEKSINEVYQTIFEATLLVILVMYLFLRSFRAVFVPLVTIPVSLIAVFTLIQVFGFTINILTLLAMVLAIGLVVDDAIVVLENIYRYIEEGMNPLLASIKGIKEIAFAVVAMTITLAAVYAPIALSTGMTGRLFREFALTLAGAVIVSGFVALTLSPMMCSRLLKPSGDSQSHNPLWLIKIEEWYSLGIHYAIQRPRAMVMLTLAVSLVGYILAVKFVPHELAPREDKGVIIVKGNGSQGATMEVIEKYGKQLDTILSNVPEISKKFTMINIPEVTSMDLLVPWKERKRSSNDIISALRTPFDDITGLYVYATSPRSFAGSSDNSSIQLVIKSNKEHEELKKMTNLIMAYMEAKGGGAAGIFSQVRGEVGGESQDFAVKIDRDRLAALSMEDKSGDVNPDTIARTIEALIGARVPTHFKINNRQYDVKIEVADEQRQSPQDIHGLFIRGARGLMIPLDDVIDVVPRTAPLEINHYNKMRSLSIFAELTEKASLGEAVNLITSITKEILPEEMRMEFSGQTREFLNETSSMLLIFGLALIFIYLVLAAQFESFIDPLIIMLSVPLSLTGGVIALKFMNNGSINLFSQIGMITLIGLITKHGILIVDFANKIREEGKSALDAVIKASQLRLRPILMTTMAMVLGALPLAFASGPGAESRQQIGAVIVGGMTFGTVLTLFVVPAVYYLIDQLHRSYQNWRQS